MALILGVSCTPHLTSRDVEIPQQYPGNLISRETVMRRKEGKSFHSMFDVTIIEDVDLPHTVTRTQDVTDTVATQQTQLTSGSSYAQIVEATRTQQQPLTLTTAHPQRPEESEPPEFQFTSQVTRTVSTSHTTILHCYRHVDYKYYARVVSDMCPCPN